MALETVVKHQKKIFFLLTFLAGLLVLSWHGDFQAAVSQGDHGRDLYAFKRVLDGAVPYRDFSWLFGPLMAYYYAAFFKVFGVSIQAVLLGQNILVLLTGVVLYLGCARLLTPAWGFLGALAYWALRGSEFFYTYNHSGGILCIVLVVYAFFRYVEDASLRHVALGFGVLFLFMLIRLNMACALLAVWAGALIGLDIMRGETRKGLKFRVYIYGGLACVALAVFVYWLYFRGQPLYVLWESFPLSKAQRTDEVGIMASSRYLFIVLARMMAGSFMWAGVGVCLFAGAMKLLVTLTRSGLLPARERAGAGVTLLFLAATAVATLHEFLFSGVDYRLFWALPSVVLLGVFVLGHAVAGPRYQVVRGVLYATVFWMAVLTLQGAMMQVRSARTPAHLLQRGKNQVYTTQEAEWFATVGQACDFIEKNVPAGEKLFAMPFDTLYNYLTGRDQPTRQWVYFQHMVIPEEQERQVIGDLEREKVNWVLVSNRAISAEGGLGLLGRDYGTVLWKYVDENYAQAARFGKWTSAPSWGWNHGVMLLKRKVPFTH